MKCNLFILHIIRVYLIHTNFVTELPVTRRGRAFSCDKLFSFCSSLNGAPEVQDIFVDSVVVN